MVSATAVTADHWRSHMHVLGDAGGLPNST